MVNMCQYPFRSFVTTRYVQGIVGGDVEHAVKCIPCGKVLPLIGVRYHFQEGTWHHEDALQTSNWLCMHDGRYLSRVGMSGKHIDRNLRFYKVWARHHPEEDADKLSADEGDEEGEVKQDDADDIPDTIGDTMPLAIHRPTKRPHEVAQAVGAHQDTEAHADDDLHIEISDWALTYTLPSKKALTEDENRRRFIWSSDAHTDVDLSSFKLHMVDATESFRTSTLLYVANFFSLFKINNGSTGMLDAFKYVYKHGLIGKAFALPIMDPQIAWSWKIKKAMAHLCNFLSMLAEDANDDEGQRMTSNFEKRFVGKAKPLQRLNKALHHRRRKLIDTKRLTRLHHPYNP
jgi:hypothetical protein